VFTNPGRLVRLFEISDTSSNIYANADYYPVQSNIEVSTLNGNTYSKKIFNIPNGVQPIATLILSWKYPTLILSVNCALSLQLQYSSTNDLNAFSLPYFNPYSINSPGYGLQSIQQTYSEAGCSTTNIPSTIPSTTFTTTTQSIPTTTFSNYYVPTDSITTIPTGNNINFNNLDSNFILSIYNTRILQYQNLLKLQQIFQDYNLININSYNLTFLNCN